jgi:hypothetical protein
MTDEASALVMQALHHVHGTKKTDRPRWLASRLIAIADGADKVLYDDGTPNTLAYKIECLARYLDDSLEPFWQ